MLKTVKAEHLEDDWYMVSYCWDSNESSLVSQIPLKAYLKDKKLQISYIPHSCNETKYGDNLLGCPARREISDISQEGAREFLESFYDVYLYNYCSMSLNLYPNLKKLRENYFTQNAQADFKKAEDDYLIDHIEGFDLLVDDFDFDPMWYKSLEITDLGANGYKVSFSKGNYIENIIFTISKSQQGYMINSIEATN